MDEAEIKLAETFGDIAQSLLTAGDVDETLRRIVDFAVELIEPCDHAGIDIVEGRTIHPVAPSDQVAERIDAIQTDAGEGPCFSAIREHAVFHSSDLADENRWPDFATRAYEETGVRSMMGFRLFSQEGTMGALDLYSTRANVFDEEVEAIGLVLAAHASVALFTAQQREQLEEALKTRDVIGQAKGILMARSNLSEDEAFDVLNRASQRMHVKVREIADRIAHPERHTDQEGWSED